MAPNEPIWPSRPLIAEQREDGDRDELAESVPRPPLSADVAGAGVRRPLPGASGGRWWRCSSQHSRPQAVDEERDDDAGGQPGRQRAGRHAAQLQRWIEIRCLVGASDPEALEQRATVGVELGLQLGRDRQALGGRERLGDLVRREELRARAYT